MSEGRIANLSAAILVGGASSRMGTDKAHLAVDGMAAAERLARGLAGLFEDVLLVGGEPPASAPGRRVADPDGPRCALRGVVGALEAARCERVLVVATDLPGLTPELALALACAPTADAVLPRVGRRLQPLCAVYRRDAVTPRARANLAEGTLAMARLLDGLQLHVLEGGDLAALDPHGLGLANVNTPEEWSEFRRRSAGREAAGW